MRLYRALYLQRELVILCCLDLKVLCCLDLLLLESIFFKCKLCFFEQDITQQTFVLVKTYWRRLENVFSVTFFLSSTTSWRCFRKMYCKYILKTSSRRLEDKKCYAEDVFKTSWRGLGKQEMFAGKSLYIHINMIYVNKNQQGHSYCWFPSLSFIIHKYGGITLAWAHFSQS